MNGMKTRKKTHRASLLSCQNWNSRNWPMMLCVALQLHLCLHKETTWEELKLIHEDTIPRQKMVFLWGQVLAAFSRDLEHLLSTHFPGASKKHQCAALAGEKNSDDVYKRVKEINSECSSSPFTQLYALVSQPWYLPGSLSSMLSRCFFSYLKLAWCHAQPQHLVYFQNAWWLVPI